MKIDVAVKFIIVLLVIMIVSLAAALIIMNNGNDGEKETKPTVTTTAADTTKPDTTTTPNQTTTPDATTTPEVTTTPEQTTTPEVTTTPEATLAPDETEPPVNTPDEVILTKSILSNTGVKLNLRADVTAFNKDGKTYLTVELYLEHYSIGINARYNNLLVIDGVEYEFSTKKISQEDNVKGETLIYAKTVEVELGDTVSVEATFNSKMTYSGVKLDSITLADTVRVE